MLEIVFWHNNVYVMNIMYIFIKMYIIYFSLNLNNFAYCICFCCLKWKREENGLLISP